MTKTAEEITPEMLRLSEADRAELAHILILSLEEPADEDAEVAWNRELDRRLQRIQAGESSGKPATEVLDRVRAKYAR